MSRLFLAMIASMLIAILTGLLQAQEPHPAGRATREIVLERRYLHLPVRTGAPKQRMKLSIGNQTIREFEIELAEVKPDFWVFADLEDLRGKTIQIDIDAIDPGSKSLAMIEQADEIPGSDTLYREATRPRFHFTSRRGWHNDPNGLVWQAGTYHLFYQHNPYGWSWGNMHWGHAVSPDLVHWTELPTALYPRQFGDWCFSGSAIVDGHNTGSFQQGAEPPLVVAYTSTGRGECIAYSNDRGKTWEEYTRNPVVKHKGRDPKLVWHQPTGRWVMAVYDEEGKRQGIAFYSSPDLKNWKYESKIDGFFECPDLFELPVEGSPGQSRWVLHAADGKYVLGGFDGRSFHVTSGKDKLQLWHGNFYAAQSFSNTPDDRRVQIGWASGVTFPGMPFNQQMTLPVRLRLRSTTDGARLCAQPVAELESLRGERRDWGNLILSPGQNPLGGLKADLSEILVDFSPEGAQEFEFSLRGIPLVYDVAKQELSCKGVKAPLAPESGRVRLQVFQDRGSIEVFGNDGRVAMSIAAIPESDNHTMGIVSRIGSTRVHSLVVYRLESAWRKQ